MIKILQQLISAETALLGNRKKISNFVKWGFLLAALCDVPIQKSYSRETIPLLTWEVGVRRPAAWAWDWSWNPDAPGTSGLWTRLHKHLLYFLKKIYK
jgi:hypothetical protein